MIFFRATTQLVHWNIKKESGCHSEELFFQLQSALHILTCRMHLGRASKVVSYFIRSVQITVVGPLVTDWNNPYYAHYSKLTL